MKWHRYETIIAGKHYEPEPVARLPNEGRELLGKAIIVEEKRDGENVSIWLDDNDDVRISSHNNEIASEDIQRRMRETAEFSRVVELLKDEKHTYDNHYIVYGELIKKGPSPTRLEPAHKISRYIVFDIYDVVSERFLPYTLRYQKCYHFRLPMPRVIGEFVPESLEHLKTEIDGMKKWCKRHKREGVVLKLYDKDYDIFAKEKIDLPKREKIILPNINRIIYPPMPLEKINRALQHAWDELMQNVPVEKQEEVWRDKSKAMPVIARHIATEAREHQYRPPKDIYTIYLNTPVEQIRARKIDK